MAITYTSRAGFQLHIRWRNREIHAISDASSFRICLTPILQGGHAHFVQNLRKIGHSETYQRQKWIARRGSLDRLLHIWVLRVIPAAVSQLIASIRRLQFDAAI